MAVQTPPKHLHPSPAQLCLPDCPEELTNCLEISHRQPIEYPKTSVALPLRLADLGVVVVESVPGPDDSPPSAASLSQFSLAESSSSCDDCGADA